MVAVRSLLISGTFLLAVSAGVLGWESFIRGLPDAEAYFINGTRLLERGEWEGAAQNLRMALASPREDLRRGAHLNLGLAYLRIAQAGSGLEARDLALRAITQNEDALRLDPAFEDAAWNLEMALARLEELDQEHEAAGVARAQRLLASFRLVEEGQASGGWMNPTGLPEGGPVVNQGGGPWW